MVKVGGFTVELVAAHTKESFKEHTASDGQVYAEVEPDMDYFISVGSDISRVQANIWVDGVNLGYSRTFSIQKEEYNGKWERRNGKGTMTALYFNKTRQEVGPGGELQAPDMLTGKVDVAFYKCGEMYYEEAYDYVSASLTADSTLGGKKCIKSTTSGSHSFDTNKGRTGDKVVQYKNGEHICTITLNYCSALGLIYHKILPPPPVLEKKDTSVAKGGSWKKRKRSNPSSNAAAVSPEENNNPEVKIESSQEKVTVQLTYDFVDLTADE